MKGTLLSCWLSKRKLIVIFARVLASFSFGLICISNYLRTGWFINCKIFGRCWSQANIAGGKRRSRWKGFPADLIPLVNKFLFYALFSSFQLAVQLNTKLILICLFLNIIMELLVLYDQ